MIVSSENNSKENNDTGDEPGQTFKIFIVIRFNLTFY